MEEAKLLGQKKVAHFEATFAEARNCHVAIFLPNVLVS